MENTVGGSAGIRRRWIARIVGAIAGIATPMSIAGCGSSTSMPSDASGDAVGSIDAAAPAPEASRQLDLLFIIDNSASMADKQANLANNIPYFTNVLSTIEGGLPNIHVGVVTTDLGTRGAQDAQPGPAVGSGSGACAGNGDDGALRTSALVNGRYIEDIKLTDGTRQQNYAGTLSAAMQDLASVGAAGCEFEQPLEAARRALDPANTTSAGFLRPGAMLALIFIADEDDCSLAHASLLDSDETTLGPLQSFRCNRFGHVCDANGSNPTEMNMTGPKGTSQWADHSQYLTRVCSYVSFFKGLKTDPANVLVAAIAGATTPYDVELRTPPGGGTAIPAVAHSCSYVGGTSQVEVADPPIRLVEFLNKFPNRNTFSTICQQDLTGALTQVAQLLRAP